MCEICGCSNEPHFHHHDHDHLHHHHDHTHDRGHRDANGHHEHATKAHSLEARLLEKNDLLAADVRRLLAQRGVLAINLVSSPGAGKTTLLERTISDLRAEHFIEVIEGDQATSHDADRIRAAGAAAVQVNTGTGCHLDAPMVERALHALPAQSGALLFIENVGNLVCPALFDLGERAKVLVASVTEGEDKPLKYPHMFRASKLVLLNKIDLLPYVRFDAQRFVANAKAVNGALDVLEVSALTGFGLHRWYSWMRSLNAGA